MSLGVLNNINAIYAANSLNNTSNSLSTVLQQLSSGSKINSGADDAAGLSLVNGLQANSMALAQSQTNASEGVGLLKVADGALSQVTNLLNRAVTLATEASNGTLNSSQDAAANSEYQSILSEINNIGTTTTYNNRAVFNSVTNIYTGDSSSTGASIDQLNIRSLSSSNVGDSGGVMSYSNGQNNVFMDLSTATANAKATDTLNGSGTTSLDFKYLVRGSNGSSTTASATISVGGASGYENTVNGLMSAINQSGLGLSATFTTQAQAGVQGGGTQTGIEISGGLISAGVDPSSSSTGGVLNPTGITAGELLTDGQTLTVKQGTTTVGSVIVGSSINTLAEVRDAINSGTGTGVTGFAGAPVTASIITNGDGTQSLSLENSAPGAAALTVTVGAGSSVAPAFAAAQSGGDAVIIGTVAASTFGQTAVTGQAGAYTFGVGGGYTNAGTDKLAVGGSITLSNSLANGTVTNTFTIGSGSDVGTPGTHFTQNTDAASPQYANTLAGLAQMIQASNLGVTAAAGAAGITVASNTTALYDNVALVGSNTITNANDKLGLYNPIDGGAATTGSKTVTVLDAGSSASQDDVLTVGTHITLTDGSGTTTFTAGADQTWADLALQIQSSNLGVDAAWNSAAGGAGNGGLVLTSKTNGVNPIAVSANNLADFATTTSVVKDAAAALAVAAPGTAGAAGTYSTAALQLTTPSATHATINDGADVLTGKFVVSNDGGATKFTFVMGAGLDDAASKTYYTNATTIASLATKISGVAALNITATVPNSGGTGAMYLQSNAVGTNIAWDQPNTTLADANTVAATTAAVSGSTTTAAVKAVTSVNVSSSSVNTSDALGSGSITIQNTSSGTAHTFTIGTGAVDAAITYLAAGTKLADLATAISGAGLGVTAQATSQGLTLTQETGLGSNANNVNSKIVATSTLSDTSQGSYSYDQLNGFASVNDTVQGTLNFSVGGAAKGPITVAAGTTVAQLKDQINSSNYQYGVTASIVNNGSNGGVSILLTSRTEGTDGDISTPMASTLRDTATTADLSFTATQAYNTGVSSSGGNKLANSTNGLSAATFASNMKSGSGTATISYTDGAGQSLSATSLSSQAEAQSTLNALNAAITAVAAMDGYIGAQINTLNAVSSVLSTQQQNVTAAQNAVQATDYASAASNMSKYEILSQTGISALAQANSIQQEVTKLLQ